MSTPRTGSIYHWPAHGRDARARDQVGDGERRLTVAPPEPRRSTRRLAFGLLLAIAGVLALLSACGGGGGDDTPPPPPVTIGPPDCVNHPEVCK